MLKVATRFLADHAEAVPADVLSFVEELEQWIYR